MNNYCTNCGKKLKSREFLCKKCNTPIVELPANYKYITPKKRARIKKILILVAIFLLITCIILVIGYLNNRYKVNRIKKDYVIPYIEETLNSENYSIKYDSSGKCIISGNCAFDPAAGCDGGACDQYQYLEEDECKSYYYDVKIDGKEFVLTAFYYNDTYSVVKGKNINGTDYYDEMNKSSLNAGDSNE